MNFAYDADLAFREREIFHDLYNKTFGREIPHEWFFIKYFCRSELEKDRALAEKFVMYVLQFFPSYSWLYFNPNDMLASVVIECAYHDMNFEKVYMGGEPKDIINQSMIFGDIVTEFLVRYLGYSLIKCGGTKAIVTSQMDCEKRFEELLENGFSIYKLARLSYNETSFEQRTTYPLVKGTFSKLPVLPTKDIHVPFEECIESSEGHMEEILQFKPVK